MTDVTETENAKRRAIRLVEADQCAFMRFVDWDGYRRMLRLRNERPRPRMIYLDGDLTLMHTCHLHERDKARLGMFVVDVACELQIPFIAAGSTTFRRRKYVCGIEPDRSYYLSNFDRIRNKKEIDLRTDPPPDLSIEVSRGQSAFKAVEVSRRLEIPEVWVCSLRTLKFLVLDANGHYIQSATSRALPMLSASEVLNWVRRPIPEGESDLEWSKDLRRWIQETLVPRVPHRIK